MFPRPPKRLLQDTNNAHHSLVMGSNVQKLIILLVIVVIVLGLFSFARDLQHPVKTPPAQKEVQASEPTPRPKTNTFIDNVFGTLVYMRDGQLFEYQFPDRREKQIVGLRPSEEVSKFATQPATWSQRGRFLAVMADTAHVYVSEYDTGKFVGSFALRSPLKDSQRLVLSFDPADEVLAIGVDSGTGINDERVLFYTLFSQKELGFYPHCGVHGVWLTGTGYVLRCQIENTASINLVRFEPTSSTMIPLTRERTGLSYKLIGEYSEGMLLALRTNNGQQDLITLSKTGKISPVATSLLPKGVTASQFANASESLKRRIEAELHVSGVKGVSVATDKEWIVYETADGLFANTLTLKEKSFFLGKGTLPVIRPN